MTGPGPLSGHRALSFKAANGGRSPASHRASPSRGADRRKEAFAMRGNLVAQTAGLRSAELDVLRPVTPAAQRPCQRFGSAGERAQSPRRAWLSLQEALPASRLGSMRRPALSGRRQGKACSSAAARRRHERAAGRRGRPRPARPGPGSSRRAGRAPAPSRRPRAAGPARTPGWSPAARTAARRLRSAPGPGRFGARVHHQPVEANFDTTHSRMSLMASWETLKWSESG